MKLEEQNSNTINNNMKGSQLMTFRMNFVIQLRMIWKLRLKLMFMNLLMITTDDVQDKLCDTIKNDMEVETEANVYEPFDEYVKQVEMKPLDDTSAEVEMNVDGLVNSSTSRFIYNGVKTRCLSK